MGVLSRRSAIIIVLYFPYLCGITHVGMYQHLRRSRLLQKVEPEVVDASQGSWLVEPKPRRRERTIGPLSLFATKALVLHLIFIMI